MKRRKGVTLIELILVAALMGFLGLAVSQTLAPMAYRTEGERILTQIRSNIRTTQTILSNDFRRAEKITNNGCNSTQCEFIVHFRNGEQVRYVWSSNLRALRRQDEDGQWTKLLEDGQAANPFTLTNDGRLYQFTMTVPTPVGDETIRVIAGLRR